MRSLPSSSREPRASKVAQWWRNGRLHRYYVCGKAQKRGCSTCPAKSVSAIEIETFVVNQIRDRFPQQPDLAVWNVLLAPERERILNLLVEQIDYDGSRLAVRFQALAAEVGAS